LEELVELVVCTSSPTLSTSPRRGLITAVPPPNTICAGHNGMISIQSDGKALAWGGKSTGIPITGILGDGSTFQTASSPVEVSIITSATDCSASYSHACYVESGAVYCTGDDQYGKLGLGSGQHNPYPVPVSSLLTSGAIRVSTGVHHTCALLSGGGAMCCRFL
jgi:alpha-tubulin suppressor-like RCC1 family protein